MFCYYYFLPWVRCYVFCNRLNSTVDNSWFFFKLVSAMFNYIWVYFDLCLNISFRLENYMKIVINSYLHLLYWCCELFVVVIDILFGFLKFVLCYRWGLFFVTWHIIIVVLLKNFYSSDFYHIYFILLLLLWWWCGSHYFLN